MNDLISRSALLELAHNHVGGTVDCNDIARFPAVDAEVVRHGKWIDGRPYVNSRWKVCSVCKECAPEPHAGYEYCPNCGAKMDGDNNETD